MGAQVAGEELARKRALLEQMLEVVRAQRRHLIEGDIAGLGDTSRLLEKLVEMAGQEQGSCPPGLGQEKCSERRPGLPVGRQVGVRASSGLAQELRDLAQRVRAEGQINYLLACRGAQFADLALSIVCGEEKNEAAVPAGATASVVDARS